MSDFQFVKSKAAIISIISNLFLTIAKLVIGFFSGSVSILSEAVHSGIDLLASIIAYISVKNSSVPPDKEHPFGHGKIENISGLIEALLIFIAAFYIIYESIMKMIHGVDLKMPLLGSLVMCISAIVNFIISDYLFRVAKKTDSVALEADAWHLRTDVYTSVGVFVGLVVLYFTGMTILDPVIAMVVALFILKAAYQLTRNALKDILDASLPEDEEQKIAQVLKDNSDKFITYHELKTRKAGNDRFVEFHLVVPHHWSTADAHDLSHFIEDQIRKNLPGVQLSAHIEPCFEAKEKCDSCLENNNNVLLEMDSTNSISDTCCSKNCKYSNFFYKR